MDRRTFLLAGAGAAVAARKPAVGIGFLGGVHSHFEGKLAAARSIPDLRVVGVCEPDPKVQDLLKKQGVPLLSRDKLISHPDVQVIAVESAVRDHARDGLAVVQAGKHLHLEKAPAHSMGAFRRIVDIARDKKLRLQTGYIFRRHPGITRAVEAARKGWLGDVFMVRGGIGNQLAANRRAEWAEFSGGVMYELGGHVIDPAIRLMGRPRSITPVLRKDGRFNDTLKDNCVAILQWEKAGGIIQSATLQSGAGRYRHFEIVGSNGTFSVSPLEPAAAVIDLEKAAGPYAGGQQKLSLRSFARYGEDLRDMVAAIRDEAPLPVSYDEDLMVHEALLRCSGMYEGQA